MLKASLRGPQGPQALKSTKAQAFPLRLSVRLQKRQIPPNSLPLASPEQNCFSVSQKGKTVQPLICLFSADMISNWRINLSTIMGYPTTSCDHKHRKTASMMWYFPSSFLNQRWLAVVQPAANFLLSLDPSVLYSCMELEQDVVGEMVLSHC